MPRMMFAIAAAVATAAVGAAGTAATEPPRPMIKPGSHAPLKVNGFFFKRSERVRVVALVGKTPYARVVRATTRGAFTVTFVGVRVNDPCSLRVSATGFGGSRAAWKLSERFCPIEDVAEVAEVRR